MNFKAVQPSLPRIDELTYDTLVLAHFADERPLRGVGGLIDWRLNGALSRLLRREHAANGVRKRAERPDLAEVGDRL